MDSIECASCGEVLYNGDLVYHKPGSTYCQRCAIEMLFVPLDLPDEYDAADFMRKDMACNEIA